MNEGNPVSDRPICLVSCFWLVFLEQKYQYFCYSKNTGIFPGFQLTGSWSKKTKPCRHRLRGVRRVAVVNHCALLCRPSAALACAANSRVAYLSCVWCGPVSAPAWHSLPMPGDALLTPQPAKDPKAASAAQKAKEKPEEVARDLHALQIELQPSSAP